MIVAFSVTPIGAGRQVGELVAEAVRVVRESGLPCRTDAMFTTIEGEWDEVMDVVKRAVEAVRARSPRVSVVLKADLNEGVTDGMTSKVATVERLLADGTGAEQTGAGETGAEQTGAEQTGAEQTGAGETGAGETGAGETGAGEK